MQVTAYGMGIGGQANSRALLNAAGVSTDK